MRLFHLLSAENALDDIRNHRIIISLIGSLNDPYDLVGVASRDPELTASLVRAKSDIARTQGMVCFSKSWKNPVIWSHYGIKHTGIGLGFDVSEEHAMVVEYLTAPIPEAAFRNAFLSGVEARKESMTRRLLTVKFESWRYEKEYRIFADLNEADEQRRYWSEFGPDTVQLREVIVGLRCETSVVEVEQILKDHGYGTEVTVTQAKLSPDRFEMVAGH